MKHEWSVASLASLARKRWQIGQLNQQMFELSEERSRIERAFLDEIAKLLGVPGAILLDSPFPCPESPIDHCIFEIKKIEQDPCCFFCENTFSRVTTGKRET